MDCRQNYDPIEWIAWKISPASKFGLGTFYTYSVAYNFICKVGTIPATSLHPAIAGTIADTLYVIYKCSKTAYEPD